ncbi:unnamed protein product, partial [Vitis vinifera]
MKLLHCSFFISIFRNFLGICPPWMLQEQADDHPSSYLLLQLGPQQLKYMTVLRDSSDCLAFSSLTLLETMAEEEEESFLA